MKLFTMERSWRNNEPRISCIPPGTYFLEKHSGQKYTDTWALVGETVSHWPSASKKRYGVVFHVANLPEELEGCIAPGTFIGHLQNSIAVINSGEAMEKFKSFMNDQRRVKLEISYIKSDLTKNLDPIREGI